jgi:hypothetical protein
MHIGEIDALAEYLGEYFSRQDIEKRYIDQYGGNVLKGGISRNLANKQTVYENETERRNYGFMKALAVESSIKFGSRIIQRWAGEKEKYKIFEEIYMILLSFSNEDRTGSDMVRTKREMNKIRNSFPLSKHDRLKIGELTGDNIDVFETDFAILGLEDGQSIKENLSYFLYVLYAQKYGESPEQETLLLKYYSQLLEFRDLEAKELLREHKNTYDTITSDQVKYLKVARAMVKNLEPSLPGIDVRSIANRTMEMAANDPYVIRKRKVQVSATAPLGKKKISDLFFEAPMLVTNAGAAALAQMELDDDGKESARGKMTDWGIDGDYADNILKLSKEIKEKSE